MPKYVRRQPLAERIQALLNPYDLLLWLSEELESSGWERLEKEWAIPIALVLNLVFIIARANVSRVTKGYDDVFGDVAGPGWVAWLATFIVHCLTLFSLVNAFYTFWRKRHYRLFENAVENVPTTPSARRVRVDAAPVSSSPLRFLSNILGTESAQSRAHPDPKRDVWEVVVWDPLPISLRLFCYFSPGHVITYWLFLPTLSADPRPSLTVVTAMLVAGLLSVQLSLLQSSFSQQSKDAAVISKEVLHEYDTKYVRPRTQPLYRDVSTQYSEQASYSENKERRYNTVDTFTPSFVINRGFKPNPNPNYIDQVDPDSVGSHNHVLRHQMSTPGLRTPAPYGDAASPARPLTAIKQPTFRPPNSTSDGGSLGVYSHAASPLRKSASTNFDASRDRVGLSPERRMQSPQKRLSTPSQGASSSLANQRWGQTKSDRNRRETGYF